MCPYTQIWDYLRIQKPFIEACGKTSFLCANTLDQKWKNIIVTIQISFKKSSMVVLSFQGIRLKSVKESSSHMPWLLYFHLGASTQWSYFWVGFSAGQTKIHWKRWASSWMGLSTVRFICRVLRMLFFFGTMQTQVLHLRISTRILYFAIFINYLFVALAKYENTV